MKNLAEFYNLKCEKSVQPMGSTSIYLMQNHPGYNNNLTFDNKIINNWWHFIGDFDSAMKNKMISELDERQILIKEFKKGIEVEWKFKVSNLNKILNNL